MKSDFSRFLHHILSCPSTKRVSTPSLSHSDGKPQSTPMLSYSGLPRISRWSKFANCFDLDTPVKPECDRKGKDASLKPNDDSLCAGRSMVEMLGVLAIIGVLSVGAIAGYSKAMMKYKLNKSTETANQLLATVFTKFATDKSALATDADGNAHLVPIMIKAGWVPDGLKPYENVPYKLQDSFGNGIWIFANTRLKRIGIGYDFKKSQKELCYNLLSLSKGWNDSISQVIINQSRTDDAPVKEYGTFYGNSSCQTGYKCLTDITLTEMDAVCNNCELSSCRFYFFSNPF